jgi:hypothetical protein
MGSLIAFQTQITFLMEAESCNICGEYKQRESERARERERELEILVIARELVAKCVKSLDREGGVI